MNRLLTSLILALCELERWYQVAGQRRQLRRLASDTDLLDDIGKSRSDALSEANKPFWKR